MKQVRRLFFFIVTTITLGAGGALFALWSLPSIDQGIRYVMLGPLLGIFYCVTTPRKIKLSYFKFINRTATKSEFSISKREILIISLLMPVMIALTQLFKIETLLYGLILFSTALMSQSVYSLFFIIINKDKVLNKDAAIEIEMKIPSHG